MSHRRSESGLPLIGALRQLRDPFLFFVVPVTFALLVIFLGYRASWPVGFDFRGTLWEPARAFLDGAPIYPEPTRDNIVRGNPAVYPPLAILASVPLAVLPASAASVLWLCALGVCVFASMWILGVRDWRCHVIALTSPVVVHGLFFGNLTILLLLPMAVAWRYRDRARISGIAVGAAVAAKLFVWPLVIWLLLTRRFRAAAWAVGSSLVLVLGAWAAIGFDGLADYPALLREVQNVYAVRSFSLASVAATLGASTSLAVATCVVAGVLLLGLAAWLVGRPAGERGSFTIVVTACILATPVVWPNYAALMFAPIAITWPRLAPAWFFGYGVWLVDALAPTPRADDICCRPSDVTETAWAHSHAEADVWLATGVVSAIALVALAIIARQLQRVARHSDSRPATSA